MKKQALVLLMTAFCCSLSYGQYDLMEKTEKPKPDKMGGFRVGATYITPFNNKTGRELDTVLNNEHVGHYITQFGWQFEHEFTTDHTRNGAVSQLILMAGGMDQGAFIPSVSWLIGFRLGNGFEFGGGPNISLTKNIGGELKVSPAFAWGTGYSLQVGKIYFPLNLAVLQTRGSLRTTVLTGFIFK